MILQDSAWFCKILQNSEAFCKIYEKFEAFIPKVFVKKLPKIEANFTNFEVWCSKTELPKIEITNIEGYQYRGIPVIVYTILQISCSVRLAEWSRARDLKTLLSFYFTYGSSPIIESF